MMEGLPTRKWTDYLAVILVLSLTYGAVMTVASAQENIGLSVVTVRDQQSNGVECTIFRRKATGLEERVNKTDDNGILNLTPPLECQRNEMIVAYPTNINLHFSSEPKEVTNSVTFILMHRSDNRSHRDGVPGVSTVSADDHGARALLYSDAAERARSDGDLDFAREAKQQVYIEAGAALGVEDPMYFDKAQGKVVASETLESAIERYQTQNRLRATRKLDSQTMQALTGRPYWAILYAVEPGANRPHVDEPALSLDFSERVEGLGDQVLVVMATNATRARATSQPGLAALLYTDLTSRLRRLNSCDSLELAVATEIESYRSVGEVLSVDESIRYDPVQRRFVMSQPLSDRLRKHQMDRELKPTGKGDYDTLRSLAGNVDVGPYLTVVRISEQ